MPQDLEKIVIGVAVDRAYSDSVKVKAQHFLADGYYDSVELIEYFEKKQIKYVFLGEMYKRGRCKVEQLFGNMKIAWGDRDRTRIYELARLFVFVRFILWNSIKIIFKHTLGEKLAIAS